MAIYSLINSDKPELAIEEKLLNISEFMPKSLLLITMEGGNYLFVALGDGTVLHFKIDPITGLE